MNKKGDKKRAKAAASTMVGKDEMNMTEFPIASLSHAVPQDCNQLIFEDEIFDQSTREVIQRKLTVTGDAELGLPNSLDDDVLMVLMLVTKQRDPAFTSRTVPYSRMEVIEMLGWPINGQSVRRLEESLTRWHGVKLDWERAWWDKKTGTWRNEKFHVLDNISDFDLEPVRRSKVNLDQATLPFCSFTWNEVLFNSFKAGYLKSIDLSFYFQLSSALSKRAYRFLDKRFYRETQISMDLRSFACNKIGLSKAYSPTKMKEKLQPALSELEGFGFLKPLSKEKRYEKVSHGVWKIVFTRGDLRPAIQEDESTNPALPFSENKTVPVADSLVSALINRSVVAKIAAELVQKYPADFIASKIEEFDWEMTQPKPPKKPAGYLVKSIQDVYATDPNFVSTAERIRGEEARNAKECSDAETRRQKQQQEAAERQEQQQANAYWDSLTPEQQAELQAKADAQADPAELAQQTGPMKSFGQTIRRQAYIRHLLKNRQPEDA